MLSAVHNTGIHIERPHQYDEFIQRYDFSDVLGEVSIEQIDLFEQKNPVSVNVYAYDYSEKEQIIPLRIARSQKIHNVNMFLYNTTSL